MATACHWERPVLGSSWVWGRTVAGAALGWRTTGVSMVGRVVDVVVAAAGGAGAASREQLAR